jgi:hypothetical protein
MSACDVSLMANQAEVLKTHTPEVFEQYAHLLGVRPQHAALDIDATHAEPIIEKRGQLLTSLRSKRDKEVATAPRGQDLTNPAVIPSEVTWEETIQSAFPQIDISK